MEPMIPRAQLAKLLGVSRKTLLRLHRAGILVGVRVTPGGRKVSYLQSDVDAYLAKRRGAA